MKNKKKNQRRRNFVLCWVLYFFFWVILFGCFIFHWPHWFFWPSSTRCPVAARPSRFYRVLPSFFSWSDYLSRSFLCCKSKRLLAGVRSSSMSSQVPNCTDFTGFYRVLPSYSWSEYLQVSLLGFYRVLDSFVLFLVSNELYLVFT